MFRIPLPKQGYESLSDGLDNIFKNLMYKRLKEQALAQQHEYQQQQLAMRQPLIEAQTKRMLQEAAKQEELNKLPFAGRQIPGAAGRALGLQLIKIKYGEDSPEYKEAKSAYDLDMDRSKTTMDYQKSLMESLPKRYATQLGKTAIEQNEVEQGFMPGSTSNEMPGKPLTKAQQEMLSGQYSLKQLKNTTDSSVRQRILYSKNMEKTLDNLNVDDLVTYSGLKGASDLVKDTIAANTRNELSPRYKKYNEALTAAKTLAKQIRQFYGDSITAGVQQGLQELTNPTSWLKHPDIAKAQFNRFKKILNTEAKTFRDATKSANIYMDEPKKGELTYNVETGEFE